MKKKDIGLARVFVVNLDGITNTIWATREAAEGYVARQTTPDDYEILPWQVLGRGDPQKEEAK